MRQGHFQMTHPTCRIMKSLFQGFQFHLLLVEICGRPFIGALADGPLATEFFRHAHRRQFNKSASNARMVVPSGQFGTRPVLNNSATFSA